MEKLCNFYGSKFHLSLILLEYIKRNNNENIVTYFEEGIDKEVGMICNKYSYSIDENTFSKTKNIYENKVKSNSTIIVEGSIKYINEIDQYIEAYIKKNNINNIKIINCFNYIKSKNISKILKKHDKILFTNEEKSVD